MPICSTAPGVAWIGSIELILEGPGGAGAGVVGRGTLQLGVGSGLQSTKTARL